MVRFKCSPSLQSAGFPERAHIPDAPVRIPVAEQRAPQLRLRRLYRDVDRTDAQVNDALRLAFGKVGQRNVIPHEKAQARVVVLKVKCIAHARRHLIDEAENAVIGTGTRLIHQVCVEVEPQIFSLFLADLHGAAAAVLFLKLCLHDRIIAEKAVIEHIRDLVSVEPEELLAHADLRFFGGRAAVDRCDDRTHASSSSLNANFYKYSIPDFTGSRKYSFSCRIVQKRSAERKRPREETFPRSFFGRYNHSAATLDSITLT
mgnify:CR=1 FL=1